MIKKCLVSASLAAALLAGVLGVALFTGTIHTTTLSTFLHSAFGISRTAIGKETVGRGLQVPAGFSVDLYAGDLPRARYLRFTPAGDLLVSRPYSGDIALLRGDADGDGSPDAVETLIEGLHRPQGMDFHDGWLYIAESNRIGRVRFDAGSGRAVGAYETVVEPLGDSGGHWKKTIRFGPDGLLYLTSGSSCNVCREKDPQRATMLRYQPDGSGAELFATGLRNSAGFDWAPWSGELYATDNGRDRLGDDFPPCELNRIEQGRFYGWPYFNGDNVPDPDMGADPLRAARQPVPPVHGFRAHNAPLGIAFPDTRGWPEGFDRIALVALHGSWNRSSPDGYKVVSLHWTGDGIREHDFLSGFLRDGKVFGRPVDVAQGPDGAIYISDDYAGAIYRVTPGGAPSVDR